VLNYVCAHEVAHLVEMNHSQKFWKQVDFLIEDWEESKKWLKFNGNHLHRFG
jgi:predicted metal-dependent hydrolase